MFRIKHLSKLKHALLTDGCMQFATDKDNEKVMNLYKNVRLSTLDKL
jgi:hypothetical protein